MGWDRMRWDGNENGTGWDEKWEWDENGTG